MYALPAGLFSKLAQQTCSAQPAVPRGTAKSRKEAFPNAGTRSAVQHLPTTFCFLHSHLFVTGGSCTDGNSCTVSDKCIGGTCYGEPKQCPPSTDQCKINTCDPTSTTGACKPVPVENGTPCTGSTSQGLCTVGDFCQAGMCVAGAPKNCSALDDDCNIGVCEIATGK